VIDSFYFKGGPMKKILTMLYLIYMQNKRIISTTESAYGVSKKCTDDFHEWSDKIVEDLKLNE